uniref:Ovule protein n=1 Tax=Macrostomum lignano TaxID=282301 RepID=A0A1I8G699_9PLAT
MYDLERGLNAYKYKWSGTDPEPQISKREKLRRGSSSEAFLKKLASWTSSCDTGRQEVKRTKEITDQINCYQAPKLPEGQESY